VDARATAATWLHPFGARSGRPAQGHSSSAIVEAVVRVSLAAALATTPLLCCALLVDIVTSARLSPAEAARAGATEAGLDPEVFDRLARIVPPRSTYWVATSPRVRPAATRQAFPAWASGSLLPRFAVGKPEDADWVVIWGYGPRRLHLGLERTHVLRVRSSRLPVYVARVIR
jgi:hypothetical protein